MRSISTEKQNRLNKEDRKRRKKGNKRSFPKEM
jgi:hypothetical protein